MFLLCPNSVQSLVQDNSTDPTPPPKKPHIHHPSPSPCHRITSGWHHLSGALVSSGFSVIPPDSLQSNLTLQLECVTLSCWKFFCGSNIQDQIQGINPLSNPYSLTLHTSTILNHYQSPKRSVLSLCASVQLVPPISLSTPALQRVSL